MFRDKPLSTLGKELDVKYSIIALFIVCGACSVPEGEQKTEPQTQDPPKLRMSTEDTGSSASNGSAKLGSVLMSTNGAEFNRDHSAAVVSRADNNVAVVTGSFVDAPSSGVTAGAVYELGAAAEQGASGNSVLVQIVARGGPLAISYSTADVGNSGWLSAGSADDWAEFAVSYDVPELKNGNGDFVGVIPLDAEKGIEIKTVKVTLVD